MAKFDLSTIIRRVPEIASRLKQELIADAALLGYTLTEDEIDTWLKVDGIFRQMDHQLDVPPGLHGR